jgi:hypothetical protein
MNHKPTMLALTAIVAAIAVTGIAAMATPVFAGGHHHHNNGIKVNQSIDQANVCSGPSTTVNPPRALSPTVAGNESAAAVRQLPPTTVCLNDGTNNADIQR